MPGPWDDFKAAPTAEAGPWQDFGGGGGGRGKVNPDPVKPDKPAKPMSIFDQVYDKLIDKNPMSGIVEEGLRMATGFGAKVGSDVAGLAAAGSDVVRGNKNGDPEGFRREV